MPRISFRRSALVLAVAAALPAACAITTHADAQLIPASCQAIHNKLPLAPDGNYVIHNGGNLFTVFCYDMRKDPREYINLGATATGENFSQYTAGGASPGTSVRTTFTKLRVDPATLTVDIGDLTFATSTGSLRHSGSTLVTSMPYGVAMSCVAPRSANGVGNIDLQNTPFQVNNAFSVGGSSGTGSATVSANNQVVDLAGGGFCGWITPSPAMFNPFNPSAGDYHLTLSCASKPVSPSLHEVCVHLG